MKTVIAMALACQIAATALTLWLCWQVTTDLQAAAVAMTKASNDYRDAFRNYEAERLRIGQALSQLERDTMRLRSYIQRKGG